jgi:hypothetical protein
MMEISSIFCVENRKKTLKNFFLATGLKKDGYTQNTNINTSLAVIEDNAFSNRQR